MSDNWIISNLQNALETWNGKLAEIWLLITETPQTFHGGAVWTAIVTINDGLKAIAYGLLILFFAMSIFKSTANFRDFQRPEYALKYFIRFVAAKVAVGYCMDIMTTVFSICGSIVQTIMDSVGGLAATSITLPSEIETAIDGLGFLASIPLWLVSLLGTLFITVMSFILIMTVYGRFFRLYLYTAIAPIPLAAFAGENTARQGEAFIKSYIGVCMEGAVVVLSCLIFSAFAGSSIPVVNPSLTTVTMVWQYLGETLFNMLLLVGLIKGADRISKEMFGL